MGKRKPRERLRPTLFQFAKIDAKKKVVNIRTWQTPSQSGGPDARRSLRCGASRPRAMGVGFGMQVQKTVAMPV